MICCGGGVHAYKTQDVHAYEQAYQQIFRLKHVCRGPLGNTKLNKAYLPQQRANCLQLRISIHAAAANAAAVATGAVAQLAAAVAAATVPVAAAYSGFNAPDL